MLRRPVVLIAVAAACAALAALVFAAALHVAAVQRADLRLLSGFVALQSTRGYGTANTLGHLFDPVPFALLAGVVVAAGMVRGRRRQALVAGAAILAANVTTELLKPALAAPRPQVPGTVIGAGAWPSGHSTAAMSLALALVVVCPARRRPVAAVAGGLLAVGVGYAVLLLGWHYPSDVVGGFLVAAAWSCALGAAALRRQAVVRAPARAALGPVALAGGTLAGAFAILAAERPQQTVLVTGAAALAAGAVALATAVAVAVSGSGPAPTAAPRRRRRG